MQWTNLTLLSFQVGTLIITIAVGSGDIFKLLPCSSAQDLQQCFLIGAQTLQKSKSASIFKMCTPTLIYIGTPQ